LLHETCNERISEAEETTDFAPKELVQESTTEIFIQQPTFAEVAEAESFVDQPKEEGKAVKLLQPIVAEETNLEDLMENLEADMRMKEMRPTEESYDILPKESVAMETAKTEECIVDLPIHQPTLSEVLEAESFIILPKEDEKIELLQEVVIEETHPKESVESLTTETTTEEMHPAEMAYDILPKESLSTGITKTEECVADLSIQQPTTPELAEAKSSIIPPKAEKKLELLQATVTEETNAEDAAESVETEPTKEEMRPTEAACDILPKESVAVETVKAKEYASDLSAQQPISPEAVVTEGLIDLPKEKEKVKLLEAVITEETEVEGTVESVGTKATTEEIHTAEVSYDILPQVSVETETVKAEESLAEITVQQPAISEETEAESSVVLPKEEEKVVELLQPTVTEETHLEYSVNDSVTEATAEETRTPEVMYDDMLPKESITAEGIKTEECAADFAVQQLTSLEEAEAKSFITLPKEEEKIELLQPTIADETNPEDSAESIVIKQPTQKAHSAEVACDISPEKSTEVEIVQREKGMAGLTIQQPTILEEAEAEGSIMLPKEEETIELLQTTATEETIQEDSVENLSTKPTAEEAHPTEVSYEILPEVSAEVEIVQKEKDVADLTIQQPTTPEVLESENSIILSKEEDKIAELLQPIVRPIKETSAEDAVELLESFETEPTTEEMHPTEVLYDIFLKESIATGTVKTGECAADLFIQQPTSPQEAEAESSIILLKEDEKVVELIQPTVTEETHPGVSVEDVDTKMTTEELHPAEVTYDILPQESIAAATVQTQECTAELSIRQPTFSEEAEAESFITLPKEEEKIELLQPTAMEKTNSEYVIEPLETEPTTKEMQQTEVAYDILAKESIATEAVKAEECVADLSIQQPNSPEVAEAEASITLSKEEKAAASFELEPTAPEVAASLDLVQPASVEETLTPPPADHQKTLAEVVEQDKIESPRPEVRDEVSLTRAEPPAKSEDVIAEESIQIPTPKRSEEEKEEGTVSLDSSKAPELQSADESLTLETPKSPPAGENESVSLTIRQPEEEEENELALSLVKQPEDGRLWCPL